MIEANGLTKQFRSYKKEPGLLGAFKTFFKRDYITKNAVEDFNLEIKKGEIIGLLGPNGAGKTTLMKMFTGIIVPSKGQLLVNGHNPWERNKDFRKKIALVMGQKSQLWWDIPAMDSLSLLQKYYEIPDDIFQEKIESMSTLLDVKELLHVHVRKLSLGERMKLELMASLLHSPDIIFLDEPTIGLDLVAQENIRNFIKEYHQKNKVTIILTSHYMADVQALCDRIVLIFKGKKGFDGPIRDFEKILGKKKTVTFTFQDDQVFAHSFWRNHDCQWSENKMEVELKLDENELNKVSSEILSTFSVSDFHTEKMPIEKVMKTLMANPEILTRDQ
ncbi:ATP-binding cassette domain-containing protein [Halobacteriovorax sp. GB3]|uniref:ABC transporter ATP-binding protein n=1 Tax=Halobacteriovorax sp. GB3 TaxID=2719615 RepID=UPI0023605744|nr:ATP-binding cassette domain-containing protein [Halobacteriovorax sp. GB3]MDD0851885.1 ATP-binding cassette domain-containing protein [Halobacteriovorax sp. GB3]